MRRGYNDHFRFQEKNPFLGEGCRVFANVDNSGGQVPMPPTQAPAPSEGNINPDERFHREVQSGPKAKEMGDLEVLYPDSDPSTPLKKAIDEYQVLRGGMEYMDRINRYLQTSTENIDTGRLPWSESAASIQEAVNKLEEQVSGLDLEVDRSIFTTIRNSEEQDQRRQMIQILAAAYEKLAQEANEKAQRVHELYVEKYIAKYDEFAQAWADAPEVYKDYAKYKRSVYKECQDNLRAQLEREIPLGEEDKLMQVLQGYHQVLDREHQELQTAIQQVERRVDLNQLAAAFRAVQQRKNSDFQSRHGAYKSKIGSIITRLKQIQAEVEGTTELDDTEKATRLKKIEGLIEGYEKNLMQSDEFAATDFSDPSFIMETNSEGEEVPKTLEGGDGTQVPCPKGLKDRIELLSSGKLKPDASNVLASGIQDELKQINHAIDGFIEDVDHNFDKTINGLAEEDINGPITRPGFNMDFSDVWMSPMDIWKMGENAVESFNRSFERTRMRKVGKLGSAITQPFEKLNWGPFTHFSVIPGDLAKKQTSAENEAVDFYQNDYKSNDDVTIIGLLHNARNQDQMKACIQLLAERGRINWFHPDFLKLLNRFQKVVHFEPDKEALYHAKEPEFYRSVSLALQMIYGDSDFFRNNNAQNQSAYNSGKEKFKQELINMSRSRGGLQKLAVEMLKEHMNAGLSSTVNPQKYEYVIELGITDGAVQPPETGLYFLIQAAASGLLPFERLTYLYANKANDIPYLEIFHEGSFNYEILEKWAAIDPPPKSFDLLKQGKCPQNFMRWFHTFVMQDPRIRNRSAKIASEKRGMDADLQALFLPYSNEDTISTILQIQPTGIQASTWLINNATQYQLFALHNTISNMDDLDNEDAARFGDVSANSELTNMVSSFIKWDSIMCGRMNVNAKQNYIRWTEASKKQKPRSGSLVNDIYWDGEDAQYSTTYGYAEKARQIITQIDPELFGILFRQGPPTAADLSRIKQIAQDRYHYDFNGSPPETADSMYEQISGLIGVVIAAQRSAGGNLTRLISQIKSENAAFNSQREITAQPLSFYPSAAARQSETRPANNSFHYDSDESTESASGFRLTG